MAKKKSSGLCNFFRASKFCLLSALWACDEKNFFRRLEMEMGRNLWGQIRKGPKPLAIPTKSASPPPPSESNGRRLYPKAKRDSVITPPPKKKKITLSARMLS